MIRFALLFALVTPSQGPPGTRQEPRSTQNQQQPPDTLPRAPAPVSVSNQVDTGNQTNSKDDKTATNWLVVLTAIIAAAGLGQLLISHATSKRQLRAYLHVGEAWLEYPLRGPPVGWVRITNAGKTPASNVRVSAHVHVGARPFDGPAASSPPGNLKGFSLGPGSIQDVSAPAESRTTSPTVGPRVYSAPTYVYGVISYRDAFGKDRSTKFRFHAQAEVAYRGDGDRTKKLALDGEGNETT